MQIESLPPQNILTSNVILRVLYRGNPTNVIGVGDLLTFRLEAKSQCKFVTHCFESSRSNYFVLSLSQIAMITITVTFLQLTSSPKTRTPEDKSNLLIPKGRFKDRLMFEILLINFFSCPADLYVFPELHKTPDGALEAEFYAFKLPDSNFLVFQATVRTCRGPCEPVIIKLFSTLQMRYSFL